MDEGVSSLIQKRKSVDSKSSISLRILPEDRIVPTSHGKTILDAILDDGLEIDHSCGGMGTCGTCRVFIEKGLEKLAPRNEPESEIAGDRQFAENERLSCQNFAFEGMVIRKPSNP